MKLRKRKFFSSIALVLSVIMLAVSGAIFVHSAQQQNASTSLTVNFNGQNVNFTANAWYQVKNTATHPYLVNTNGTEGISISASDAPSTATLNVQSNNSIELTASNTYVLFTYKFANTASTGAYGMEISLTGSTPVDDNIDVKYLVSSADATDYYSSSATDEAKISALTTKVNAVTGTSAFSNIFIQAGHYKYFYILVSLKDNTISATYNNTLTWTVTCSDDIEEQVDTLVVGILDGPGGIELYYQITEAVATTPLDGAWRDFDMDYTCSTGTFLDNYQSGTGKFWTTLETGKKLFIRATQSPSIGSVELYHYGDDTVLWNGSGYYSEIITEDSCFRLTYSFAWQQH